MHEVTVQDIQSAIITLPNRPPAMLASKVAEFYEAETRQVNQAVTRNPERFPDDFCFKLSEEETATLKSQNVMSNGTGRGGVRHAPWLFTRMGANMLSAILKSDVAAKRSVQIMRAFSMMEEVVAQQPEPAIPDNMILVSKDQVIEWKDKEIKYLKSLLPKKRTPSRPLTTGVVAEIHRLKDLGLSQSDIAKRVNRSSASVSFVVRGAGPSEEVN